jgi:RNA polymerase sigma-70 factor (ECF subfamily)
LSRGEAKRCRDDQLDGLFRRYADDLRRFAIGVVKDPLLADDVVQGVFRKLAEHGPLKDDASYKAWLFTVAYRDAVTVLRRQQSHAKAIGQLASVLHGQQGQEIGGADALVRKEEIEQVREAIARLPEAEQAVVRLRVYQHNKFREIAEKLQIPLGTALSRMKTALRRLADDLQSLSEIE